MSDSSESGGIFGDQSQDSEELEQREREEANDPSPAYCDSREFKIFVENQNINLNEKYGYIYIHTYKPFYFPGEIVRGSIILDIFNQLPSKFKKVMIRITGREYVGKHYKIITKAHSTW